MANDIKINKEEKTSSDYLQYKEFGGIIDLELNIRLPDSYYEAAKEYCNVASIPIREWLNAEILDAIEAIELGHLTDTFVKKHNLRGLSKDKREAMLQVHRMFTLKDKRLNDS